MKLYILRGLPGSGKSTLAKELGRIICSADDYFMTDDGYIFDVNFAHEAHNMCFRRCIEALINQESVVIIDNTNIQYQDYYPYIRAGEAFGYKVIIMSPDTGWRDNPEECYKRTTHNVPLAKILQMAENWE